MPTTAYQLVFYVPAAQAEAVKDAVFAAGAGAWGRYDRCSWETRGTGQFRPLPGSRPFIGESGKTEQVEELKVELICSTECLTAVIAALKTAHPYETPAFFYWSVSLDD